MDITNNVSVSGALIVSDNDTSSCYDMFSTRPLRLCGRGMERICPNCGFNLGQEEQIRAGPFAYDSHNGFMVEGCRLRASRSVHVLLGMLMRNRGGIVSREAILNELGSGASRTGSAIAVFKFRATEAIEALNLDAPIETVSGLGLRWAGPSVE
jgi:DNA-binding response OmpR family regulator